MPLGYDLLINFLFFKNIFYIINFFLKIFRIFIPSTIAVFGPELEKKNVPNSCVLDPTTVYGVTKVFMENMGNYYHAKHGVDFRSIRYPGVISPYEYESNGTTDYASEIYFYAAKGKEYIIPLEPHTVLPFVYLKDVIEGTVIINKNNLLK